MTETNRATMEERSRESAGERAKLWACPEAEDEKRRPWGALVALMALAAVLRGIALNQQLWYDEITTLLDFVRTPMAQIVTTYTSQNQHMLYSVLARVAVVTFGDAAWTLRLPAMLFGVLTVPALYFFARLLATRREALLACALLTVSYQHVWFSQNARGYTGLAFFTLVTTYFFIRGARQEPWSAWMWYAIALALGMYTHLTMGFVAAGHGIVYLWLLAARARESGRLPRNWHGPLVGLVLAGILTAALYAPVMGEMIHRTVGAEAKASPTGEAVKPAWKSPLWLAVETLRGLGAGSAAIGFAVATLGGLVVLAGLWSFFRENRAAVGLMIFPGVVTAAAMLALSRNLWPRFFFFAIGFGLLLIVRGAMVWAGAAARMWKRETSGAVWGTAVVAVLLLGSCVQLRAAYRYPKQDFLGAMNYVDAEKKPGDAVVLVGLTTIPYQRYYGRDWPSVETREQLDALGHQGGNATWVLYTIPIYVESRYPQLWHTLQSECPTVKVFRGTMGGGEVYVCRVEN